MNKHDKQDELPVENLQTARFECVFPTCGGICCRNGRPAVEAAEAQRIQKNLPKFLPHLRPASRKVVEADGFLTRRTKEGLPTLAVKDGWCVFENEGCVLHKVGLAEGEKFRYKPWRCVVFPLERSKSGRWHVRQHGLKGEAWDLFCLDPKESEKRAADTLGDELEHARETERRLRKR
ncbi:MAG: DUF3109 family protein [Planctomycetes bacterium]|nr:DUF3109 family protein [Planctomycetota bacterium]